MKTDNLNIGIAIWVLLLVCTSCTNREAYADGQWWAEECCKMLEDEDYSTPVDKQYMRMKYATDNCNSDFFEGFEDYSVKESTHKEYLMNQLRLMKEDCENVKKE